MSEKTRRAVVSATAMGLLGGCVSFQSPVGGSNSNDDGGSNDGGGGGGGGGGDDSTPTPEPDRDGDGVPDIDDEYPDDSALSRTVGEIRDTRRVPEDEWYRWEFEFTQATKVSYEFTVRDGPAIDVLFMEPDEYRYFSDGDRARYLGDLSHIDAEAGGASEFVEAGTYYFVLDNTDWGTAPPTNFDDDVAEIEVELVAAQ
jgi:hypothetical protein